MTKKKEAYYFSHDSNARHDPKIMKLRSVYGNEGYADYFMIIEILRDQQTFKLGLDEFSIDAIAYDLRKNNADTKKFIFDCISYKLFIADENYFWSESLYSRMKLKAEKSKILSKNAFSRWDKKAMQLQSKSNPNALQKESNKRKGKESKENKTSNEFESFWNLYNKKRGNKLKVYTKFCNLTDKDRESIFKTLPDYVRSTPDKQYRKDPMTYLNNKSWNDEIIISTNGIYKPKDLEPEKF